MSNLITPADIEKARNTDITQFLNVDNGKYFCCPFHSDNKPSAHIYNNLIMCQTCSYPIKVQGYTIGKEMKGKSQGRYYNTIDLIMFLYNLDFYGAIRKILGTENIQTFKPSSRTREKENRESKYKEMLKKSVPAGKNNYNINRFLKRRGILGILNYVDKLGIELRYKNSGRYKNIIYNFKEYNFAVVKGIDSNFKGALGKISYVYLEVNPASKEYYICEGIEDSFSLVLSKKANVVCLNSVNNADEFLNDLVGVRKAYEYIITTDNDKSGLETAERLLKQLSNMGVIARKNTKFYEYARKHNLKDVNEVYLHFSKTIKGNRI
ncbi:toprim domain-containing protein [Clostridium perfringens]